MDLPLHFKLISLFDSFSCLNLTAIDEVRMLVRGLPDNPHIWPTNFSPTFSILRDTEYIIFARVKPAWKREIRWETLFTTATMSWKGHELLKHVISVSVSSRSLSATHQRLRIGLTEHGLERVPESPWGPSIGARHLSTLPLKVEKDTEACQVVESISLSILGIPLCASDKLAT